MQAVVIHYCPVWPIKAAIAARVAAALRRDPELHVETVRGGLGELRVSVGGQDAVTTNRLLYTRPSRIVEKVRAYLNTLTSKTNTA